MSATPSGGGNSSSAGGAGGGSGTPSNKNKWRRAVPATKKFEGSCDELKGAIYDCSGYNQSDLFTKTSEKLSIYVGRTYKDGGTMSRAVETLVDPVIIEPPPPANYGTPQVDPAAKYRWEQEMKVVINEQKDVTKQKQ